MKLAVEAAHRQCVNGEDGQVDQGGPLRGQIKRQGPAEHGEPCQLARKKSAAEGGGEPRQQQDHGGGCSAASGGRARRPAPAGAGRWRRRRRRAGAVAGQVASSWSKTGGGKLTRNRLPGLRRRGRWGTLKISTSAPCCWAISRTMARPSPLPGAPLPRMR